MNKEKITQKNIQQGFSLLELVLVILILSVVLASIFSVLNTSEKTFDAELANAEAQENARYAVDRISEIVQTAGNNPQNLTALNGLSFLRLYDSFSLSGSTPVVSPTGGKTIPQSCSGSTCPTGPALELFSDFDGDRLTTSDVGTTTAGSTIFSTNIITSEHIVVYLDPNTNLVNIYNYNGTPGSIPIAEFVTFLQFTVDSLQNEVTVEVTARSQRAVSIESTFQRRFRYANLVSTVKLRNR